MLYIKINGVGISQVAHTHTHKHSDTHMNSSREKVLTAAFIHLSDTEAAKLLIRRLKTGPAAGCQSVRSSSGSYASGYPPFNNNLGKCWVLRLSRQSTGGQTQAL